jgi:HAD superfamily hydrolase (TIGR01490 family)
MNSQISYPTSTSYAFFDVDDTLISVKSMLSFQDFWYQKYPDRAAECRYRADLRTRFRPDACWASLNRLYYSYFAGRSEAAVIEAGRQWFEQLHAGKRDFFHSTVVADLLEHASSGRPAVFVSGSFPALLKPIAKFLGVRDVLATQLEVRDGLYTGAILPPQTIGEGKAEAIRRFLSERQVPAASCYAYGDDISDLPMLEAVGHPVVVPGGRGLEAQARVLGWRVMSSR